MTTETDMTPARAIAHAMDTTKCVQVAPRGWTVDTYDSTRRAWIQGVTLDYHKARRALSECRVFMAARAMGMDAFDAETEAETYRRHGIGWRAYIRDMHARHTSK